MAPAQRVRAPHLLRTTPNARRHSSPHRAGACISKDPKILILGEATSALDSSNETRFHAAMEALLTARTSLVIAHRFRRFAKPTASSCS
jgi:hypothetical protein